MGQHWPLSSFNAKEAPTGIHPAIYPCYSLWQHWTSGFTWKILFQAGSPRYLLPLTHIFNIFFAFLQAWNVSLKETEIVICYCVQSWVSHGFLICPEMQTTPEGKSVLRDASQWEVQYGPQCMTKDMEGSSNGLGLLSTISRSCKHQQEIYNPLLYKGSFSTF